MAEEAQVVETTQETGPTAEVTAATSPFENNSWSETPSVTEEVKEGGFQEGTIQKPAEVQEAKKDEPIDTNTWFKDQFKDYGWEDAEKAKADIAEWKKAKDTPSEKEIQFANEQSQLIHELIREGKTKEVKAFLETQEKIESVLTSEVTKDNAGDIIKLGLKLKYPTLTDNQIDFQYKQEYAVPKQPVQKADELDEEFNERMDEWKEKAANMEMKASIAATMAKPEIEKAKSQIQLPELPKKEATTPAPSKEQLDAMEKARVTFLSALESNYNKAEGFSTLVKDESVEIPVSFKIPDEQKVAIKERLKGGFDVNAYVDNRWFDEQGAPKVETMISDLFILENLDKILSSVANNSATKRLEEHRKQRNNVEVTGQQSYQKTFDSANGNSKVSPFSQGAWSEKPPNFQN